MQNEVYINSLSLYDSSSSGNHTETQQKKSKDEE